MFSYRNKLAAFINIWNPFTTYLKVKYKTEPGTAHIPETIFSVILAGLSETVYACQLSEDVVCRDGETPIFSSGSNLLWPRG